MPYDWEVEQQERARRRELWTWRAIAALGWALYLLHRMGVKHG